MLTDKKKYKNSLADLWHEVFGDDYSYIELIFKEEYSNSILCFAELDGEKAASALYLLKNTLTYDGECYSGYYLYAAATLPEYRKKGLMTKLINEARLYCEKEGYDFISLVPSNDGLYSYYSKSGFCEAMYCFENIGLCGEKLKTKVSTDEYYIARRIAFSDSFDFDKNVFGYACECLKESGADFFKTDAGSYCIYNCDDEALIELIPLKKMSDTVCKKKRFGMLCPINEKLKREWKYTDIYMNIALD